MSEPCIICKEPLKTYRKNRTGMCIKCWGTQHQVSSETRLKMSKAQKNITNIGRYKPGEHPSLKTQFKKGLVPWNKGKPYLRREKHPMWKGGLTPLIRGLRNHPKYKQWRMDVFQQGHFVCTVCGTNRFIEAHHKESFSLLIRQHGVTTLETALVCYALWDVTNGMTLCASCHELVESKRKRERSHAYVDMYDK